MRNGQLDNEEKARAVLVRMGRGGNPVADLDPVTIDELAGVYDECLAPEALLAERVRNVMTRRSSRLAQETKPDNLHNLFRNRKPQPPTHT